MTTPGNAPYKYLQFKGGQSYRRYIQVRLAATSPSTKPQELSTLHTNFHGSYGSLLLHPDWKAKRKVILRRDMYRCVHCHSDKGLQVHHRQYHFMISVHKFRLPWDYPNHLLITLCESCHRKGHSKYKVPTITV